MRKVVYFLAGTVADFAIPDKRFDEFRRDMDRKIIHSEEDLEKARHALDAFVQRHEENAEAGAEEILAACFVWNYFNTQTRDDRNIKGDVMIVDLNGDGMTIEYAATDDIQLAPTS